MGDTYMEKRRLIFSRNIKTEPTKMPYYEIHDFYELYFLEKGKTTYLLENKFYFLESGTIFFVPSGAYHKTDNEDSPYTERLLIHFDKESISPEVYPFLSNLGEQNAFHIQEEYLEEIRQLFLSIERESESFELGNHTLCNLHLSELLIKILRYSAPAITVKPEGTNLLIKNITNYIQTNYNQDISLQQISQKFSISPSYLSRLFKQQTSICLTEYITIVKITAAKKLLLDSNKSIAEIADACGFHDSNYFAAVFKKFEKTTPKKYALFHKK